MILLAIDTSTDETSVAVVNGRKILSNVISSQVRQHRKFGGVVPFLAQRLHKERIDSVVEMAISRSGLGWRDIDAVAVTEGPGLAPALQVGIEKARDLAQTHCVPLYAVNHMAGHIASCLAQVGSRSSEAEYPALAVLVSGGHSELVLVEKFGEFEVIGQTVDDALGEAYDKVAVMLGLSYPGGKLISKFADSGSTENNPLPVPMLKSKDLNLSYSGLKNAVRLWILELKGESGVLSQKQIANVCACFQEVALESLMRKVKKALDEYPETKTLMLGGGVSANTALRALMRDEAKKRDIKLMLPVNLKLCTDNAAMIGVAASLGIENGQKKSDPALVDRKPALSL